MLQFAAPHEALLIFQTMWPPCSYHKLLFFGTYKKLSLYFWNVCLTSLHNTATPHKTLPEIAHLTVCIFTPSNVETEVKNKPPLTAVLHWGCRQICYRCAPPLVSPLLPLRGHHGHHLHSDGILLRPHRRRAPRRLLDPRRHTVVALLFLESESRCVWVNVLSSKAS